MDTYVQASVSAVASACSVLVQMLSRLHPQAHCLQSPDAHVATQCNSQSCCCSILVAPQLHASIDTLPLSPPHIPAYITTIHQNHPNLTNTHYAHINNIPTPSAPPSEKTPSASYQSTGTPPFTTTTHAINTHAHLRTHMSNCLQERSSVCSCVSLLSAGASVVKSAALS